MKKMKRIFMLILTICIVLTSNIYANEKTVMELEEVYKDEDMTIKQSISNNESSGTYYKEIWVSDLDKIAPQVKSYMGESTEASTVELQNGLICEESELITETVTNSRSNYSYYTKLITYKDSAGNPLYTVDLECVVRDAGSSNGYILGMTGTYEKHNSLWSCYWDTSEEVDMPLRQSMWLVATQGLIRNDHQFNGYYQTASGYFYWHIMNWM